MFFCGVETSLSIGTKENRFLFLSHLHVAEGLIGYDSKNSKENHKLESMLVDL